MGLMSLIDVLLPKKYKDGKVLFEKNLNDWRKATESGFLNSNYNLAQIAADVFGSSYVYYNNGAQSHSQTIIDLINNISVGAIPISGTTYPTWTIRTGGNGTVLSTAGLTATRTYTFLDSSGQIVSFKNFNSLDIGYQCLYSNTTGYNNIAIGYQSLFSNTNGHDNIAIGKESLYSNIIHSYNIGLGYRSLYSNTAGYNNIAIGFESLYSNTTGHNNIGIGYNAGTSSSPFHVTTENNRIVLGDSNITNAYIQVAWTVASDERDKADITTLDKGLEYILKLRPVEYKWDRRVSYFTKDKDNNLIKNERDGSKKEDKINVGFISQEVIQLEKELNFKNDIVANSEKENMLLIKETAIIPFLVKAIQQQQEQIEYLKSKLT